MRVISGILKGHRINPPQGLDLRPTTDFAKEALFNILEQNCNWPECEVLDLFSGTGNISFEFSSRGCKSVTAVEKQVQAHRFIRAFSSSKNLNITVFGTDIKIFLKKNTKQFDLVFADPPYALDFLKELPDYILNAALLKPSGQMVIEHGTKGLFTKHPHFIQERHYGAVHFSWFLPKI
jgi:16S rRNA (guanine966-N2)-methyltransferase